MQRLIVTGANGVGKSHLAARLRDARPEIPLISFDAIKLTSKWKQQPRSEVETALSKIVNSDAWILEGGPSLLAQALPRADAVIWLDPSETRRAWRLLSRPWRNFGKSRPELPAGNVDWPLQQYRFAIRSIKNRANFRNHICACVQDAQTPHKWHCKTVEQVEAAVEEWRRAEG